jgi:hypothetical protein
MQPSQMGLLQWAGVGPMVLDRKGLNVISSSHPNNTLCN